MAYNTFKVFYSQKLFENLTVDVQVLLKIIKTNVFNCIKQLYCFSFILKFYIVKQNFYLSFISFIFSLVIIVLKEKRETL